MSTLYYLRRVRDGAYWRPEGRGYTDKVAEAGRFMALYAREVAEDSMGETEAVPCEEGSYISRRDLEEALEDSVVMAKDDKVYAARIKANLAYLRKYGTLEVRG